MLVWLSFLVKSDVGKKGVYVRGCAGHESNPFLVLVVGKDRKEQEKSKTRLTVATTTLEKVRLVGFLISIAESSGNSIQNEELPVGERARDGQLYFIQHTC